MPSDLLHYSKLYCIILRIIMLYCSLFSLCCYCFLRICTLNKGHYCKGGNLPLFQLQLKNNPILFEILHVGRDKAFHLSSWLSGKHSSIIALSGSYTDKFLFKMKPERQREYARVFHWQY